MWFFIAILFLSLLSFLDLGIFTYIGYSFNVSPLVYGIIAATWSLIYIISNKLFGNLADKGENKLLMLISLINIFVATFLFSRGSLAYIAIAYVFHAISVSTANLSVSSSIFELTDSESWWKYSAAQRLLVYLIRGTTLLLISTGILSLSIFQVLMIATAIAAISAIVLPSIGVNIERKLHLINKNVSNVIEYSNMKSLAAINLENPTGLQGVLEGFKLKEGGVSSKNILLSLFFAIAMGDFMFTIMPLLIKGDISLNTLWISHGITGIVIGISLVLMSKILKGSKKSATFFVLLRGLWLALGIPLLFKPSGLILYLIIMYLSSSAIDTIFYNLYSETNSGYGANNYFIVREMGTLFGSLIAGMIMTFGLTAIIISLALMCTIALISIDI
ncbi:MFS transporter [Fervidicoccus fontis]|uniref:MFS transporter n=1 Tax=Fervidicoccus fontis TaxID=683846 RepID=A0A7C2V9W0_9CREN|nr:MFS transporter [Fervidicoccus fontis]PMB77165.1 MAG: hypothetical protein C0177_04095 [Fervidicoccus fontis]HEW63484.1 hypothetical protein [Fervidicoccus fontis]